MGQRPWVVAVVASAFLCLACAGTHAGHGAKRPPQRVPVPLAAPWTDPADAQPLQAHFVDVGTGGGNWIWTGDDGDGELVQVDGHARLSPAPAGAPPGFGVLTALSNYRLGHPVARNSPALRSAMNQEHSWLIPHALVSTTSAGVFSATRFAPVRVPRSQPQRPEIQCKHFFYGYPFGAPASNDMIIRDAYALSSNDDTKFADWVAYRVDPTTVADLTDPERKWRADPWLEPEETLEPSDYTGASNALGYDRGHQAPLASFKGTLDSRSTNYLSNITPQLAELNQGPWMRLEEAVRDVVRTHRTVWVMTGPLFETTMEDLPNADEPHQVPSGYWKIVATGQINNAGSVIAVGFIMEQDTPRGDTFTDSIVRIDEIEQRSGLDFFWDMPTHIATQLQNVLGTWPPVP